MSIIALEEHWHSHQHQNASSAAFFSKSPPALTSALAEVGPKRIADMDKGEVKMQILSHGPGQQTAEASRSLNDEIAAKIKEQPERFRAFATLPMDQPEEAAEELERCVKDLDFVGALIDNHLDDGTMYDAPRFRPVFAKAVELDVPLYIHPHFSPPAWQPMFGKGVLDEGTATRLSMAGWGWHATCGLHFIRLWASGLFDEFPTLKLILGHMGEMLPFQIERTGKGLSSLDRKRSLLDAFRENAYITTSGMFTTAPFHCLYRIAKPDHIMLSVDYPFSSSEFLNPFVQALKEEKFYKTEEDFQSLLHGNAERLLKIK